MRGLEGGTGGPDPEKIYDVVSRIRGYKTFFMLNSTKHEISTAHKTKIPAKEGVTCFKSLR